MGSGITIEGQIPNDRRIIGITVRGLPTATLLQIQWNDTDKVFEFVAAAGGSLSGIAFLMHQEFLGNLISSEGNVTAAGDIATITAAVGKDLYIASAKVVFVADVANAGLANLNEVALKINGTIIETTKHSWVGSASGGVGVWEYEFKNIGHKVATGEIIKIEAITLDADISIEGFIECVIVDTGVDPTA